MNLLARLLTLTLGLVTTGAGAQPPQPVIAVIGADVLPMTGPERLADQTIILRGDRIVEVGPRRRVRIPAGARRIEARGMTLMPGLVDMHVHVSPTPGDPGDPAHRAMAVMLGHGVTTARAMVGSLNNLIVRAAIERGALPGPRLYVAAPGLTAANTPNPEAARAAVIAAAGYDFMKIFNLPEPATWQALQDSARAARLPVAGHVANAIGAERAAAAGQQIEHLDSMLFALLPADSPARATPFGQFPPAPVLEALADVGDAELDSYARRLAGTWHVPTLSLFVRFTDMDTPIDRLRAAPELRYVPPQVVQQWADQRAQFRAQSGFTVANAASFNRLRQRLAAALHRAGARLMAGSDTAQQFQIWGPGLLAEMDALHAAGLSRMEVLRSATIVPRDYFRAQANGGSAQGRPADFGTVEPGARADLILLRGDPSRDLAALRQLDTVIAAGRVHDRAALDAMLDSAARAAAATN